MLSRGLALENALAHGHITFEEYVEALDENGGVPKEKFRAILERRRAQGAQGPQGAQGGLPGATPPVGAGLSAAGAGLPAVGGPAAAGMPMPGPGLPQMGMGGEQNALPLV